MILSEETIWSIIDLSIYISNGAGLSFFYITYRIVSISMNILILEFNSSFIISIFLFLLVFLGY